MFFHMYTKYWVNENDNKLFVVFYDESFEKPQSPWQKLMSGLQRLCQSCSRACCHVGSGTLVNVARAHGRVTLNMLKNLELCRFRLVLLPRIIIVHRFGFLFSCEQNSSCWRPTLHVSTQLFLLVSNSHCKKGKGKRKKEKTFVTPTVSPN